jgi:hypothetical protein
MRKPIIEHLRDIADSDVRDRAVRNCISPDVMVDDIEDAIYVGITWRKSPEGYEYWNDVIMGKKPTLPFRFTLVDRITQLETQHATLARKKHERSSIALYHLYKLISKRKLYFTLP